MTTFFKENGTLLTILILGSLFIIFAGMAMLKGLLGPDVFLQWAGGIFGVGSGIKLAHSNAKKLADSYPTPLAGPYAEKKD